MDRGTRTALAIFSVLSIVVLIGSGAVYFLVSQFSTPTPDDGSGSCPGCGIDGNDADAGAGAPVLRFVFYLAIFILGITAALFVFTRLGPGAVNSGRRKEILAFIETRPGSSVADLRRALRLSSSSAAHHLDVLEKYQAVVAYRDGRAKRYFPNADAYRRDALANDKQILSVVHNQSAAAMLRLVLDKGPLNGKELAGLLDLHPSTVLWHGKSLMSAGLVDKVPQGREVLYQVPDEEMARQALQSVGA